MKQRVLEGVRRASPGTGSAKLFATHATSANGSLRNAISQSISHSRSPSNSTLNGLTSLWLDTCAASRPTGTPREISAEAVVDRREHAGREHAGSLDHREHLIEEDGEVVEERWKLVVACSRATCSPSSRSTPTGPPGCSVIGR